MSDINAKLKFNGNTIYPQTKLGNIINNDGTPWTPPTSGDGGGTEVVANPQTSETDEELNSIQIGGENYKILGGVQFVNALPTPSQAEYNKHLLYLYNGNLEYLTEVVADEPVVTTPATLPMLVYNTSACAVGTDCYIFGGYSGGIAQNRIIKFDSVSQTATTLSATFSDSLGYTSACAVGTDCYIFGGSKANIYYNTIIKFDSVSQTATTLSATLPDSLTHASACAVGTNCYVFGGYTGSQDKSTIIKFDSVAQTVTTLSATLPNQMTDTSACAVGTDCYIFGGSENTRYNTIVKFDSISQTVTTLSATLPNRMSNTSACAVGTNCYVFGGYTGSSALNSIVQVAFDVTYTYNKLQKEGK